MAIMSWLFLQIDNFPDKTDNWIGFNASLFNKGQAMIFRRINDLFINPVFLDAFRSI